MKFIVEIESRDDAVVVLDDARAVVARIVDVVAKELRAGFDSHWCCDDNGNRVGQWMFDDGKEDA